MNAKLAWTLRLIPAVLIGQTLPFKFTGAAEPVALFTDLAAKTVGNPGLEGAFRIGTGVVELIAVILLLLPKQSWKGALLVVGTMTGALASHLLFIGFSGYGPLPAMAVIALIASLFYLAKSKNEVLEFFGGLKKRANPLEKKPSASTVDNSVIEGEA